MGPVSNGTTELLTAERAAQTAGRAAVEAARLATVAESRSRQLGNTNGNGDQAEAQPDQPRMIAQATRDAALEAAAASREATEAAAAAMRAASSFSPRGHLVIRREVARAREAAERAAEALDEARDRVVKVDARSASNSLGFVQTVRRSVQAAASFSHGNAALQARRYQEARDYLTEATSLYPTHDEARAMLAWAEYFLGDFRSSIVTFKSALRRQPTWAGLHDGLGWGRLRLGRYHLAVAAFRNALERNPDYVDALNGLGTALFELGQYEAALPALEKALDGSRKLIGPEPPEVTTLRAKVAWSLYYLERRREALAMFIRASVAAPDAPQLRAGMGWCYLMLGQKDDARASFLRAIQLGSEDEAVREGLRRTGM